MSAVEVEVKFRVEKVEELEKSLRSLGFHQITPRTFESNILYDTQDRSLRAKRELLRIRHYNNRWLLTHKRVPDSGIGEDRHKHRVETETDIADGDALGVVFGQLGYEPVFVYEKWRAEYADATGHCVVDETPIGVFAELEGPEEWIDSISARLNVAPSSLMTLSYGRLFDEWCSSTGSPARDMTFAAVESHSR